MTILIIGLMFSFQIYQQRLYTNMLILCVSERLKFKPVPINARLELGSVSRVACRADGRVSPAVRWYAGDVVGGLSTRLPEGVRDSDGVGDLTFDPVDRIHAGTYTCVASSEQGTINSSIRVDVVGKYTNSRARFYHTKRYETNEKPGIDKNKLA